MIPKFDHRGWYALAALLLGTFPSAALANRNGPLHARNGSTASSGASCKACHGSAAGGGSLQIQDIPVSYLPNVVYDWQVRIQDNTKFGAGCQISVENSAGTHMGTLMLRDAVNTQFNPFNPKWMNHTSDGVDNSVVDWASQGNAAVYLFRWQAPATNSGPVTFWVAGNAINNNLAFDGDIIYLTSITIPYGGPPTGACCDESSWSCMEDMEQADCEGMDFRYGGDDSTCATIDPPCVPPPGIIVWNSDILSPERATRSLRFRVDAAAAATATSTPPEVAIKITPVSLQRPDPRNLPQNPPPDYSKYDTAVNGICIGGTHMGHRCDIDAHCPGSTCGSLAGCTAAGEAEGCARWVGKPGTFLESQDGGVGAGIYRAARLQCTPFYWNWVAETATNPIAVVGAEIAPSSEYSAQTYSSLCKGVEDTCTEVSASVTMFTRRSGDVEAPFNPPATSDQPNAVDVTQLVNKFKNATGALVKAVAQLQPNLPELNADINALDIVAVVDGVKQFAYTFSGPCPCPSAVNCAATPCATPSVCTATYGAGALCVKTCTGGDNLGDPCINASHCPGGSCSNGFCRDRCGRCTP